MLGSETAQEERRSIFSTRPISTARLIALRVVDLLVFESRANIARVATHLPPPSAIALKIACKTRCSARLKHAKIDGSRQVDRLLSHNRPSQNCARDAHSVPIDARSCSLVSALTFCSCLPWWELSPPNRQGERRDL